MIEESSMPVYAIRPDNTPIWLPLGVLRAIGVAVTTVKLPDCDGFVFRGGTMTRAQFDHESVQLILSVRRKNEDEKKSRKRA